MGKIVVTPEEWPSGWRVEKIKKKYVLIKEYDSVGGSGRKSQSRYYFDQMPTKEDLIKRGIRFVSSEIDCHNRLVDELFPENCDQYKIDIEHRH